MSGSPEETIIKAVDASSQARDEGIYNPGVHSVQRTLASGRYVLIGISDKEDGGLAFAAHEVGVTRREAAIAVCVLGERYMLDRTLVSADDYKLDLEDKA